MTLTKLFDKTLKAARQSALQIYGDDFTLLSNLLGDADPEAVIEQRFSGQPLRGRRNPAGRLSGGVVFERSKSPGKREQEQDASGPNANLQSIREYAARQADTNLDELKQWIPNSKSPDGAGSQAKSQPKQLYSRKDIRANAPESNRAGMDFPRSGFEPKRSEPGERNTQPSAPPTGAVSNPQTDAATASPHKTESRALHERLERLESLLHLSLSSPANRFDSHPIFHKLLHKGVPRHLINQWFEAISRQGINPETQKQLFQSKLLALVEELLATSGSSKKDLKKILLICGRSGTGKTRLIMKLSQHTALMGGKKIAVASFTPPGSTRIYSILPAFCRDNEVPYYHFNEVEEVADYRDSWKNMDHLIIDTPPSEVGEAEVIRQICALREKFTAGATTETHYLINTAVQGIAFNDPLAAELEADHIALTHIDQSMRWGQALQLIASTDYRLRYISSGPESVSPFDPNDIAQRLFH